jgi:hypothetical protein
MEFKDPGRIEEVGRDMIVEAAPVVSGPRPADRNIASNAEEDSGIYRPSRHLERVRDSFERQGRDPQSFVRSHVRRLEALRRAGHVERIDADNWKVSKDIVERGRAYDLSQGGDGLRIRMLSALSLDRQVGNDGATWLDRQIVADDRSEISDTGFGRDVNKAISRRAERLVEMGLATAKDGNIRVPVHTLAILERQEVDRVGQQMAKDRGLTFVPSSAGEHVNGRLAGVASLVSGRFAMIENGLGSSCLGNPSLRSASVSTSPACSATTEASNGPLEETGGSACSAATANSETIPYRQTTGGSSAQGHRLLSLMG